MTKKKTPPKLSLLPKPDVVQLGADGKIDEHATKAFSDDATAASAALFAKIDARKKAKKQ